MRYAIGLLLLVGCSGTFAGQPAQRTLTFEGRVAAQKAIEQVYWNHRIWPKENPGPKPPLSAVMTDKAIRDKVTDYVKKSNALETWWQRRITADQLQAELDRMAKSTRDAAALRELFEALGNDPLVIAETLARQTLADRLIRNWYAYDTRFHGAVLERAEHALADAKIGADLKTLGGVVREMTWVRSRETADPLGRKNNEVLIDPGAWNETIAELHERFGGRHATGTLPVNALSSLKETADELSLVMVVESSADRVRLVSVVWPKTRFEAWWASQAAAVDAAPEDSIAALGRYVLPAIPDSACTPDTWQPTKFEMPRSREGHTVVWTGTEMIVWGGVDRNFDLYLNNGARYNPSTDTWTATSTGPNAPSTRGSHTAVWSGTEMIVWGGYDHGVFADVNSGGRYSPSSDTWTATGTAGAPTPRERHTAIWTGTQMIVWGGASGPFTVTNDGGRYTPSTDAWTATNTGTNVPSARYGHTAIWTGSLMVVWGGQGNADGTQPLNTGGRYTPGSNSWVATATGVNAPSARSGHTAIWTGTQMVVWGGEGSTSPTQFLNTGGRYFPGSDTWVATGTGANVPSLRQGHSAVWSGTEMIVWGGQDASGTPLNSGGRYNLSTLQWTPTSTGANAPAARSGHTAVWTGAEMIVWGGYDGTRDVETGGRYSPSTDGWVATASSSVPESTRLGAAIWTGTEMIVWGGADLNSHDVNAGSRYNPSTDAWTPTSTGSNNPSARESHTAVWTGTTMIVWGGSDGTELNTGGRYDPSTDTWAATSTAANVPSGREFHTAVWTGTQMVVWGGSDGAVAGLATGGRYNPSADGWLATSTGANTPSARSYHTAVWTGTEMIVWGGVGAGIGNSGGRYNPSTDGWTATSTGANTPAARYGHTAVWTGTEMIIWGGNAGTGGGRYNPVKDAWVPTGTGTGVPSGRGGNTAVWTGTEMIVWGGENATPFLNDGGRYSPSTDTWTATSTGANVPSPRIFHYAVWTGAEMIVWGGRESTY